MHMVRTLLSSSPLLSSCLPPPVSLPPSLSNSFPFPSLQFSQGVWGGTENSPSGSGRSQPPTFFSVISQRHSGFQDANFHDISCKICNGRIILNGALLLRYWRSQNRVFYYKKFFMLRRRVRRTSGRPTRSKKTVWDAYVRTFMSRVCALCSVGAAHNNRLDACGTIRIQRMGRHLFIPLNFLKNVLLLKILR